MKLLKFHGRWRKHPFNLEILMLYKYKEVDGQNKLLLDSLKADNIEEAGRLVTEQNFQLQEKEDNFERLEAKITSLKEELKNLSSQLRRTMKFKKSTKILHWILSSQRSPSENYGLGYGNNQNTLQKKDKVNISVFKIPNCNVNTRHGRKT